MSQLVIDLSGEEFASVEARAWEAGYPSPAAYAKDVLTRSLAGEATGDELPPDQEQAALDRLGQLVKEGRESGDPIPVTDEYWERRRQAFLARHPDAQ